MFKMTIEGSSPADLKSKLQAAAVELGGASISGAADKAADKAKPAAAAAPKAAKTEAPAVDFKKDVAPLILQLADKNRDKAKEVLATFGAAKGSELKAEQYAEAITALKAAIEATEDDLT
jgi:hypothetical protein